MVIVRLTRLVRAVAESVTSIVLMLLVPSVVLIELNRGMFRSVVILVVVGVRTLKIFVSCVCGRVVTPLVRTWFTWLALRMVTFATRLL